MIVRTNVCAGQDIPAIDPNQALALGAGLLQTYGGQVDQQALMDLAGSFAANPNQALALFAPQS